MVIDATALSLAKGAEGPTVGASRAYTNKGCGKDKYNCGEPESTDQTCTQIRPICHRCKLRKELL